MLFGNKNSIQRCPYKQKLITEAKANSAIDRDKNCPPALPITKTKASLAESGEKGTPLHKMARAVAVQTSRVSQNTSKIPQNPCSTGELSLQA